ncbi:MAG: PKD domain-containing protein [Flavobacterium sp.]|nr:PKD domain-containing protein [Flavobacterium sp.]
MCTISIRVDYTSTSPISTAQAICKHTTLQTTNTYSITPPASPQDVLMLPLITIAGTYELKIRLVNQEGLTIESAPTTFLIGDCGGNRPPVANAGPNLTVTANNPVILNGAASSDPDGNGLTYLWSFAPGQQVIQGASIVSPNAVTTEVTGLSTNATFRLTVSDINYASDYDDVLVTVSQLQTTPAHITGLTITPTSLSAQTSQVTITAATLNPSGVGNLKYEFDMNGSKVPSFVNSKTYYRSQLSTNNTVKVRLIAADGNNFATNIVPLSFYLPSTNTGGGGGGSFMAGTPVRMADGTLSDIETIQAGDSLKGSKGSVTVTNVITYESEARKYRLNNSDYFVTETHPIMTTEGWKSFNPEKTREIVPSIEVNLLRQGDVLVKENGELVVLDNEDFITVTCQVYNFAVDGTHDFYANGYLVHNKLIEQLSPNTSLE